MKEVYVVIECSGNKANRYYERIVGVYDSRTTAEMEAAQVRLKWLKWDTTIEVAAQKLIEG